MDDSTADEESVPEQGNAEESLALLLLREGAAKPAPTLERRTMMQWARDNVELIKVGFLLIAGIYAAAEYKGKDYLDKVNTSFKMVDEFKKSEDYKSLSNLDQFYSSDELEELRSELRSKKISSDEYHKQLFDKTLPVHREDLTKAATGLQSIAICGIQGHCEPDTLCMHFAIEMQDFRCNFRDSIAYLSEKGASCLIDEVNYFVDNYCKAWMQQYLGATNYQSIQDNKCLYTSATKTYTIGELCTKSIVHENSGKFLDRFFK